MCSHFNDLISSNSQIKQKLIVIHEVIIFVPVLLQAEQYPCSHIDQLCSSVLQATNHVGVLNH